MYPNPAANEVTVEQATSAQPAGKAPAKATASAAREESPFTVRLLDSYGKQVLQQAASAAVLRLSTGQVPAGLYLLRIEVNGTVVQRRQLQITH